MTFERSKRLMLAEDEKIFRDRFRSWIDGDNKKIYEASNAHEAECIIKSQKPHVSIIDLRLPPSNKPMEGLSLVRASKIHNPTGICIVLTMNQSKDLAIDAEKYGAWMYLNKPIEKDLFIFIVALALNQQELVQENHNLRQITQTKASTYGIIGESKAINNLFETIIKVSGTNETVLIEGETGTGKELVARAIHKLSYRDKKKWAALNCGAVPESLMDSELFGHEAGAFTGATRRRKSLIEYADKGTLFLDEIQDMPLTMQRRMLRTLQEGVIKRIGSETDNKVDLRIIAATNQNVEELVKKGLLRHDLYYRLNTIRIKIPPLRERRDDIKILAYHFLEKTIREHKKKIPGFDDDVMTALREYNWPGNVRELEQQITQIVTLTDENQFLTLDKLSPNITRQVNQEDQIPETRMLKHTIDKIEKRTIEQALHECKGNKSIAAKSLKMDRKSLYRKIDKHGIK